MPLIEPGRKAPAFTLKDQHGQTHRLADYEGRHVILYFYPKDDTPGCTKESCDFQASLPQLKRRDAVVLGVSILDEKSKAKFAGKHGLTFPLLADADHEVAEQVRCLAEEVSLRPIVYGDRAHHIPDRAGRESRRTLGQRQGRWARRHGGSSNIVSHAISESPSLLGPFH